MCNPQLHLLFSYPGSKYRLGPKYIQLFPPHKTFVDVFGGSGALIARKSPSDVEVFNDLDSDVINVFRVIRSEQHDELVTLVEGTRNTRQQYDLCRAILDNSAETPVRKAWAFIACGMMGYNLHPCITRTYGDSPKATSRLSNCPKWLAEWRNRLANIRIENKPWQDVIAKYDSESTVFLLDPPYMPGVLRASLKKYYPHAFSTDDHIELLETVQQVKGKVLLCGYNHPTYLRRLWHWRNEHFDVNTVINRTGSARQEQVWLNYDADGTKHIHDPKWLAKQFIGCAGLGRCDRARQMLDLSEEITFFVKGASSTFRPNPDMTKLREGQPWFNYAANGCQSLDNRLWVTKQFVLRLGGFQQARQTLTEADCPAA